MLRNVDPHRHFSNRTPQRRAGETTAVLILNTLFVAVPFTGVLIWMDTLDRELKAMEARLDKDDPHWRLDEIEAKREKIPDDKNAALVVMKANKLLPTYWPDSKDQDQFNQIHDLPRNVQLTPQQTAFLSNQLQQHQKALTTARTLIDFPRGRYPVQWTLMVIDTSFDDLQHARSVATFLSADATLLAQQGKLEEAWKSCHAMMHTASSIGDEPSLIVQLIRIAIMQTAHTSCERTLAQGEIKEASLVRIQEVLKRETAVPLAVIMYRGERAGIHEMLVNIETGKVPMVPLDLLGGKKAGANKLDPNKRDVLELVQNAFQSAPMRVFNALTEKQRQKFAQKFQISLFKGGHLRLLWNQTKAIELAKLPLHQQRQAFETFDKEFSRALKKWNLDPIGTTLAGLLTPAWDRLNESTLRHQANLHCAVCGLALERYRLKHNSWPKDLDTLVKEGFLKEVPIDPYSGKPLQYRQAKNGVVVYSVGPDGKYQGTSIGGPAPEELQVVMEFRLWNVNQRRQPAKN